MQTFPAMRLMGPKDLDFTLTSLGTRDLEGMVTGGVPAT